MNKRPKNLREFYVLTALALLLLFGVTVWYLVQEIWYAVRP